MGLIGFKNKYAKRLPDQVYSDVKLVISDAAYTWFGRPNAVYSPDAQKYWIGTTKDTDNGTTQHITEFNVVTQQYMERRLGNVYQKDDHNQSQILIRQSDNRLIAFYSEHAGAAIRYRISINPFDASDWGPEQIYQPNVRYSYVSPYQASNGNIFIFFRSSVSSGVFAWYYSKSTDGGVTFGTAVEFGANYATQYYLISNQLGDQVHFTASDGHPSNNSSISVSIYHFYFDLINETAHQSDGTNIALPITPVNFTLIRQTSGMDTSWCLDIAFKNGLPRVLYVLFPEGRANSTQIKELYFAEWDGIAWVNDTFIAQTLDGYIDNDTSGDMNEKAYPPASRFDAANPDIIWMPKQVSGIIEIHKVNVATNPIEIEQITFNSDVDNWRPLSVASPINNLLWLKKKSYLSYLDYEMNLQAKTVQV